MLSTDESLLNDVLMDGIKDMVFVMKVQGGMEFVYDFINKSAAEGSGITQKDLGKTIAEVCHPEKAAFLYEHHQSAVSTGQPVVFCDWYTPSETLRYTSTLLTPLFDESGVCTHVVSVVKDASETVKAQNQLKKREEQFRNVAQYSSDLMSIVDRQGIITFASPSHESVLGYERSEYEGEHQAKFVHPEDHDMVYNEMAETIKFAKPFKAILRILTKTSDPVLCEVNGTPVFHSDGTFRYMAIIAQDISMQKKRENDLQYLAYHDPLTGLPNRRLFKLKMSQAVEAWYEEKNEFAIIMFDIDRFKRMNDEWGHVIGDQVIEEFGHRLNRSLHSEDMAARLGGDEFAVLLSEVTCANHARTSAEAIQSILEDPWDMLPADLQVHVSMGIAFSGAYTQDDTPNLLKDADKALYNAKQLGGNMIRCYHCS